MHGKLNICYFFKPKVDEVLIIGIKDFLIISLYFILEESSKVLLVVLSFALVHAHLHMAENYKIKDS